MEGRDVKREGVYKGDKISRIGDPKKKKKKKEKRRESRTRIEREESEQCFLLGKICLFRQACNKPSSYFNSWPFVFLSCFCPRAEPSLFI